MHLDYAAGEDYTAVSETLIFTNDTVFPVCIEITILQDGIVELTEEFSVILTSLSPDELVVIAQQASVLIADDNDG